MNVLDLERYLKGTVHYYSCQNALLIPTHSVIHISPFTLFSAFFRPAVASFLCRRVASHLRLTRPLLPLLLRCVGANQQRAFGHGVSRRRLLHHGGRGFGGGLRRLRPLPDAAAADVAAAEPPAAAATVSAVPSATAPAIPAGEQTHKLSCLHH